tara:strand:+ start:138 stop:518 length:381 start_codon:yes stop_codon:yes gene_type:complete
MQNQKQIRKPLLEENQGNHNPNGERSALGATIMGMIGLAFLGTLIWYASTHSPQQGVTRRVTENDNVDSLPLLSISLLGLAAVIASTKTNSIQNFSLGSIFNKKTVEPENGSKDLEKGTQRSPHNA